jgi:excisionase family DNA binding protein
MSETQLLTLEEAAKRLSCSVRTLRREIDRGRVSIVRLGRAVRVSVAEIERVCGRVDN